MNGKTKNVTGPVSFKVIALKNTTLPAPDRKQVVDFQERIANLARDAEGAMRVTNEFTERIETILQTLYEWKGATAEMITSSKKLKTELDQINFAFYGYKPKASFEEIPPTHLPLNDRLNNLAYTHYSSTSSITTTEKEVYRISLQELAPILKKLKEIDTELKLLQDSLKKAGAPWTPGQKL